MGGWPVAGRWPGELLRALCLSLIRKQQEYGNLSTSTSWWDETQRGWMAKDLHTLKEGVSPRCQQGGAALHLFPPVTAEICRNLLALPSQW